MGYHNGQPGQCLGCNCGQHGRSKTIASPNRPDNWSVFFKGALHAWGTPYSFRFSGHDRTPPAIARADCIGPVDDGISSSLFRLVCTTFNPVIRLLPRRSPRTCSVWMAYALFGGGEGDARADLRIICEEIHISRAGHMQQIVRGLVCKTQHSLTYRYALLLIA